MDLSAQRLARESAAGCYDIVDSVSVEIVNIEIYRYVRLALAGICDMGHAMMVIYGGEAEVAYPHFLGPIVR